jgi:hypothetical protein
MGSAEIANQAEKSLGNEVTAKLLELAFAEKPSTHFIIGPKNIPGFSDTAVNLFQIFQE